MPTVQLVLADVDGTLVTPEKALTDRTIAAVKQLKQAGIGFGAKEERDTRVYEDALCGAARSALPPELYNRIDEVMAFAPLGRGDVAEVARRMLRALGQELEAARGVKLDVSDGAIDALLAGGGFDVEMGARPMRRAIGRLVEAPIAEMILRGELSRGDVALVDVEDGKVVVDAVRRHGERAAS